MKKVIVILLSILSVLRINAQDHSARMRFPEPVKVIALYTGAIILNAAGDGLNDSGKKSAGHILNAASIGLLLTSPVIIDYEKSHWAWYLTTYVTLRIAFFDYTYNMVRGLPPGYIGTSNYWDNMLGGMNINTVHAGRGGAFILGVSIPISRLGKDEK